MTKEHYLKEEVAEEWCKNIRDKVNNQAVEINKLIADKEQLSYNIKYLKHIYNLKVETIDLLFSEMEKINSYILEELKLKEEA